jgi:small subunit ribosomal protein S11e
MMNKKQTIGYGIPVPQAKPTVVDTHCPFTTSVRVRGNVITGTVVSASAHLTATIQLVRQVYVSKYRRYKQKLSKVKVHNPALINAKVGDIVECMLTRPISKTKSMTITQIVGHDATFAHNRKELLEQAAQKEAAKQSATKHATTVTGDEQ